MTQHHTRARPALDNLRREHRAIRKLLREFEAAPSENCDLGERLFRDIRRQIRMHFALEEEILYPAVLKSGTEQASGAVEKSRSGHERLRAQLTEMEHTGLRQPVSPSQRIDFRKNWEQDAAEEEGTLYVEVLRLSPEVRWALRAQLLERHAQGMGEN